MGGGFPWWFVKTRVFTVNNHIDHFDTEDDGDVKDFQLAPPLICDDNYDDDDDDNVYDDGDNDVDDDNDVKYFHPAQFAPPLYCIWK